MIHFTSANGRPFCGTRAKAPTTTKVISEVTCATCQKGIRVHGTALLVQVEGQLSRAAEAYKSGQVASKPALAKVKRLVRAKLALIEAGATA